MLEMISNESVVSSFAVESVVGQDAHESRTCSTSFDSVLRRAMKTKARGLNVPMLIRFEVRMMALCHRLNGGSMLSTSCRCNACPSLLHLAESETQSLDAFLQDHTCTSPFHA